MDGIVSRPVIDVDKFKEYAVKLPPTTKYKENVIVFGRANADRIEKCRDDLLRGMFLGKYK